jgi:hypothetical protein
MKYVLYTAAVLAGFIAGTAAASGDYVGASIIAGFCVTFWFAAKNAALRTTGS